MIAIINVLSTLLWLKQSSCTNLQIVVQSAELLVCCARFVASLVCVAECTTESVTCAVFEKWEQLRKNTNEQKKSWNCGWNLELVSGWVWSKESYVHFSLAIENTAFKIVYLQNWSAKRGIRKEGILLSKIWMLKKIVRLWYLTFVRKKKKMVLQWNR